MPSIMDYPTPGFIRQGSPVNVNTEVAKDILKPYLPPDMVQDIDWDTLRLTNKSSVAEALKQTPSELVFKCLLQDKRDVYIYVLLNDQPISNETNDILACWMLKYGVSLMKQHLDEGHTRLPIILNVCLYAGSTSRDPYSRDVYECFVDIIQEATELPRAKLEKIIRRSR